MICQDLLRWLRDEGLWVEEPPFLTLERACRRGLFEALRVPAPPRPRVVRVPEPFAFAPLEALADASGVCEPLTARPECGVRFWRPLPRRVRPEPPPRRLRALWVIGPGRHEGQRFAGWRSLASGDGADAVFAGADPDRLLDELAAGVDGLFLVAHGDEEGRGFWLRRGVSRAHLPFAELARALGGAPTRLRFLFAFLCGSAEAIYHDLLLPLAELGRLDADFGAVLFWGSPLHDHGPRFLSALLKALASPAAARDPAPFLWALARARLELYRAAGREEAARPLAFALRAQAHPWPPAPERRLQARMLGGADGWA